MRILMLAPECVAGPGGTPRCVAGRVHGLAALGHEVVLVTYPFGEDIRAPGLRIVRVPRSRLIGRVPVGPSFSKLMQDIPLFRTAARMLREERFDLLHTHEEAGWFGIRLSRRAGIPHLYDMHSSLPEGFRNYGWHLGPLDSAIRAAERWVLRNVDGVIAICPALAEHAASVAPGLRITVIENSPFDMISGRDDLPGDGEASEANAPPLYCGGFERNQGVDMLARAVALCPDLPPVDVYGGRPDQVERARRMAEKCGAGGRLRFLGAAPFLDTWEASRRAAVLLSPRIAGTNVPSKIYHYLRAGRPIVATDVPAHRQVLDESCAILTKADPLDFSEGLRRALSDAELSARIAAAARKRYEERYTFAAYLEALRSALSPWTGEADGLAGEPSKGSRLASRKKDRESVAVGNRAADRG